MLGVEAAARRAGLAGLDPVLRLAALPCPGWLLGWTALGVGLCAPHGAALHEGSLRYLGAADRVAALQALRGAGDPGRDAARMAAEAAAGGDPLAALFLRVGGLALGASTAAAVRHLGLDGAALTVVYVAALFRSPDLLGGVVDFVQAACPLAVVQPPLMPPALVAALAEAGRTLQLP